MNVEGGEGLFERAVAGIWVDSSARGWIANIMVDDEVGDGGELEDRGVVVCEC